MGHHKSFLSVLGFALVLMLAAGWHTDLPKISVFLSTPVSSEARTDILDPNPFFQLSTHIRDGGDNHSWLFLPIILKAPTIILRVSGNGPYRTIQETVTAAKNGAAIQVAQGLYSENITVLPGKSITLQGGWNADFTTRSADNLLTCVDGGGHGSVFDIHAISGAHTTVQIRRIIVI